MNRLRLCNVSITLNHDNHYDNTAAAAAAECVIITMMLIITMTMTLINDIVGQQIQCLLSGRRAELLCTVR